MSRRVLVLAVLAALFGVAALWPAEQARGPALDVTLPALTEVSAITISRTGADTVTLQRAAAGWRVGPDPLDPHALAALEAALSSPVGVDAARPLDDPAAYGVSEHAITVGFDDQPAVRIGKVVNGRRTFIWRADRPDRVYRASANLRTVFDRPPESWADRRLFAQAYTDIRQIESQGPKPWSAARDGPEADWNLAGAVGDQSAIAGVVNTLVTAQATGFVEEKPTVERTLVATTFDGQTLTLQVGPKNAAGRVVLVRDRAAQLPHHLATFLALDADAVREARVFPVAEADVAEVLVGDVRLERTNGEWPTDAVQGYVQMLTGLRSAGAAKAPEGAFSVLHERIVIRTKDDRQLVLEVGGVFNGEARYARTPGRSDFVLSGAAIKQLAPPE